MTATESTALSTGKSLWKWLVTDWVKSFRQPVAWLVYSAAIFMAIASVRGEWIWLWPASVGWAGFLCHFWGWRDGFTACSKIQNNVHTFVTGMIQKGALVGLKDIIELGKGRSSPHGPN